MRVARQLAGFGSALIFSSELFAATSEGEDLAQLVRGPYLQRGTPTSVVLRWRTNLPDTSRVQVGRAAGQWEARADNLTLVTNHEVVVEGLLPDTQYFYSVGSVALILAEGPDYFFLTAPLSGKPTRIWVLGDSGTGGSAAAAVRDAYYAYTDTRHTDLWLMLGDNAYGSGTDPQYQRGVYDMYPEMLRKSVLWPTLGNHDTDQEVSYSPDYPYFQVFTLPTGGEAGGLASGTEQYYSFDYGDIHFICLDSMTSDRLLGETMCIWLEADLEASTNLWQIAFWHHPPYTKGSHNSDTERELIEMRENVLPILEDHGVDLVLAGHSHIYERSYLLAGHYGHSTTFTPSMMVDDGDGRPGNDGAYRKARISTPSNRGTVYVVAGSSGQVGGRRGVHPAMFISLLELGSLVLDIDGPTLRATFLEASGEVGDWFVMSKDPHSDGPLRITRFTVENNVATLVWNSIEGERYSVQAATNDVFSPWYYISGAEQAAGPKSSRTIPLAPGVDWSAFRISHGSED